MSSAVYSLYIVRCADDSLYTGIAADVDKRLAEHASSVRGSKYLRGRGPLRLEFAEEIGDRAKASALEYRVKQLGKAKKEALISGQDSLEDLFHASSEDQASGPGCR